jgi:hypothetical protein
MMYGLDVSGNRSYLQNCLDRESAALEAPGEEDLDETVGADGPLFGAYDPGQFAELDFAPEASATDDGSDERSNDASADAGAEMTEF